MYQIAAFRLSQGHGLFHKDVLTSAQRFQRLRGMMLIAAGDKNNVDFRVLQYLLIIGSAVSGSEARPVAFAAHAAIGMNGAQADIGMLLQLRQVRPASQIPRADQRHSKLAGWFPASCLASV